MLPPRHLTIFTHAIISFQCLFNNISSFYLLENNKNYAFITLAVPRSFKNSNGEYETDFVDCILWDVAATNTVEYCNKGDILGVRGRLQSRTIEKENEEKRTVLEVICERITFLSSKKPEEISNVEQENIVE